MKNSILKIALIVFLFAACDSNSSSEKKTDTPTTNTAETTTVKTPTAEAAPSEIDAVKEIKKAQQMTAPPRNEIQDYFGMYMYMADANSFSSCDKKTKMSIAAKGKYLDLERKYLTVADGGDKVFIHFKGKVEKGKSMEGKAIEVLVISELIQVDKAKRCD